MDEAALWLFLLSLPAAALYVLIAPPLAWRRLIPAPRTAVALWSGGLLCLGLWVFTTLAAAVRADETQTSGRLSDLGTLRWLVTALMAAVLSVLYVRWTTAADPSTCSDR